MDTLVKQSQIFAPLVENQASSGSGPGSNILPHADRLHEPSLRSLLTIPPGVIKPREDSILL